MAQFNLLPAIKMEYLKAERIRRIVIGVSAAITIVVFIVTAILFSITTIQEHQLNALTADITKQGALINTHPGFDQILTIQNQINTLETLHQQEPATDRLAGYLYQIIPVNANLSSFNIDYNANTVTMNGTANTLATVNQLVDTLKFAQYSVKGVTGINKAFTSVVLTSFGLNQGQATFTVEFNFNPALFNNTQHISLDIKNQVTTRSQLDQPIQLFKLQPTQNGGKP